MKTDNHNDWTDAFRDSFPQEAQPEAGGWEAVAGRMRRAAARRRAAVAAAALALPLAAGLLFLPSNPGSQDIVAEAPVPEVVTSVQEIPSQTPDITSLLADVPAATLPVLTDFTVPTAMPTAQDAGDVTQPPQKERIALADDTPVVPDEAKDSPAPTPINTNTVTVAPDAAVPGFDEHPGNASPRHHTVSVGVHAGSTAAGATTSLTTSLMAGAISTKAANNYYFNNTSGTILQHKYVHDLPVSLGLTARYGLTDRLWLESGLDFTRMHSRLDGLHTIMLYAGIPLRASYLLYSTGQIEAYAGLGGKAEKCLRATLGGMKVSDPGLQWSGSALLGAQVRLTRTAWIYVQPELTYYFTKSTLVSYRSENRQGLTVNAGLRFDLSR